MSSSEELSERLRNLRCTDIEAFVGLGRYVTKGRGISGVIKERPEEFKVWEVLEGGVEAIDPRYPVTSPILPWALYVLYKRDRELVRAVSEFAKEVGTRPSRVSVGGVKDRRAETWQFIAIPTSDHLRSGAREVRWHSVAAKHIGFIDYLSSSKIIANRFKVVVSRIKEFSEGALSDLFGELKSSGVPNYFGHQRFGVVRPISHLVGRLIVRGEYEEAVRLFIGGHSPFERREVQEMRRTFFETQDYGFVVDEFPSSLRYEKAIARHLMRRSGDFVNALRRMPLRLRRLIVESYASFLFNKALNVTLSEGLSPLEPTVGDLITVPDVYGYPSGQVFEVTKWNIEEVDKRLRRKDVYIVMPVPGHGVRVPRGARGSALQKVLEEEGVRMDQFRLRGMNEAGTVGSFRPILVPRFNVTSFNSLDESSAVIDLEMSRGSYATCLLREVMKSECALAYVGNPHVH
ncbi:MAG: tRNA pseudouridine(13) synthase TruD [Aigarchaeota archaeon]|nr:tRNA pseudouridine(13) synthase TruD [Aigarchaeota archaeon]MDW8092414.1 tRNA pseudouridine(13) synthase TruD [Nitrososphaerota archaeon]